VLRLSLSSIPGMWAEGVLGKSSSTGSGANGTKIFQNGSSGRVSETREFATPHRPL